MPAYKCRMLKPLPAPGSPFPERTLNRATPEEAAQDFHFDGPLYGYRVRHETAPGSVEYLYFARVEVESEDGARDSFISKVINSGVHRVGGVKVREPLTIEQIAEALGLNGDPTELLDTWDGEESVEAARANRLSEYKSRSGA